MNAPELARPVQSEQPAMAFPRIERYFPQCKIGVFEAVARFVFGIQDFGKLYGRHTFTYKREPGPIRYHANGVELDLWIHCAPLGELELESAVEDIYGLRFVAQVFQDLKSYVSYCVDNIARGLPVATNFDLKFVADRREYGKVSTPHIIALHGYDARTGSFVAAEQMLGTTTIERHDLEAGLEQVALDWGGMHVWRCVRVRDTERQLTRAEVLANIDANIENLSSSSDALGLSALGRFCADLTEYIASNGNGGRPFSLPGLWVFSHERHVTKKWLSAIEPLCGDQRALLDDFRTLMTELFNGWLGVDYLLEKCLVAESGKGLRGLSAHLERIMSGERRALEHWQRVREAVKCTA